MKRITLFALFVLLAAGLYAGNFNTLGLKTGSHIGWFSGSDWNDYIDDVEAANGISITESPYVFIQVGIFGEIMLSRRFGVLFELNYTRYGQNYEYSSSGSTVQGKIYQNSIQLPILMKVTLQKHDGLYIIAGPAARLLIERQEMEDSGGGVGVSGGVKPDNSTIWEFMGGLGYDWHFNWFRVNLEARYTHNLSDAFDYSYFDVNGVQLLAGMGFSL